MNRLYFRIGASLFLALILIGCVSGVSRQARSQVTYNGPFNDVRTKPDAYKDKIVMWGGRIIETRTEGNSTEMVVLQLGLTVQGYPVENDRSQGRFLVRSDSFMDPAIYPDGALITVVGRVEGSESQLIGEMSYLYPVIGAIEIKKWRPGEDPSPRFHFGIGIGAHF